MPRRRRFTIARMMLGVAALATVMGFCLVPLRPRAEWWRVRSRMDAMLRSLPATAPTGADPVAWNCARGLVITAYGNVCFSEDHVCIEEMYRLHADLELELAGEVDQGTLRRIWARLGRTGPHGRRYIARNDAQFHECDTGRGPQF